MGVTTGTPNTPVHVLLMHNQRHDYGLIYYASISFEHNICRYIWEFEGIIDNVLGIMGEIS